MSSRYRWIPPEDWTISLLRDADLLGYITNSSAYHKKIVDHLPHTPSRSQLEEIYQRCRDYATSSIVNGLTPVSQYAGKHLYCADSDHPFRILARVWTDYNYATAEENAAQRQYQSFSILENQNLSHFPGKVLYGYYSHITPAMIGYIYPMDANTRPVTENRLQLAFAPEILLDLDDLLVKTRKHGSYCQVSVFTKCRTSTGAIVPLRPDCVIAIDKVDQPTREAAIAEHLPIVTIHRAPGTLYHVHDDCLEASHWNEWILPMDRNAPRYDEYDDIDITDPAQLYRDEDDIPIELDFGSAAQSLLHNLQHLG